MTTTNGTDRQHHMLTEVPIDCAPLDRFDDLIGPDEASALHAATGQSRGLLAGRTVWNVNSTDKGGGVAEMLHALLPYVIGAGIETRWLVIEADDDFFEVTKRIHNRLHDEPGDGGALDDAARSSYERTLARNRDELVPMMQPGDVVVLHDPQTAGLIPVLKERGLNVVWRCHVGVDAPGELTRDAWAFLHPYVDRADRVVFTREEHVWEGLDRSRVVLVAPSIDPFSAKNQELDEQTVEAILDVAGVVRSSTVSAPASFIGRGGVPGTVRDRAEMIEDAVLDGSSPIVVQVSRWDRLKDPVGVLVGFAEHIAPATDAHLVLAGPESAAVADDPEGAGVMADVIAARERLEPGVRARVHLACLPMSDEDQNSAIVNALQRRAAVVVQKSLAEGFGLTVAEAMWKHRPVVASARGGIKEQVQHCESGLLVDDPEDLTEFGAAVVRLLTDHDLAARLGDAAHERVREHFLPPRHLRQYAGIVADLIR
jgi:trehalose synthase